MLQLNAKLKALIAKLWDRFWSGGISNPLSAIEQITYLLEGALKFIVQGEEILVRAGEVLVIPSNVPHRAEALEDSLDLDIFCPSTVRKALCIQ